MNDRHPEPEQLRRVAAAFRTLDTEGHHITIDFQRLGISTVVGHRTGDPPSTPQCRTVACHAGAYLHHVERTEPARAARAGMIRERARGEDEIAQIAEDFDELDLHTVVGASRLEWPGRPGIDDPQDAPHPAPFWIGARFLAEDLGFEHPQGLLTWTAWHPEVWGSDEGSSMFESEGWRAFTAPGAAPAHDLDLAEIAEWYDAVAVRVEAATPPTPHRSPER